MTAVVVHEIRCDCTGCDGCTRHDCTVDQFGTCGYAVTDYGTATQVRARLRANGWRTGLPGGTDTCWDCAGGTV